MRKIIPLTFTKTGRANKEIDTSSYGNINLDNKENLAKITKFILPIIEQNEGWDTGMLTAEKFKRNPKQFQAEIDSSLFANVHVVLEDDNPVGLIEYLVETVKNPLSKKRASYIKKLIEDKKSWTELLEKGVVKKEVLDKYHSSLKTFFSGRKIYSEIGLTVKPQLQGKKSGISELLYELISDGIIFAWTNNPIVIAQLRKIFKNVLFYPLFGEKIDTLEKLAALAILYGDLQTYEPGRWEDYEFGAMKSPYFVSSRDNHYSKLAKNFAQKGKINTLDEKRICYCIEKGPVQGAIFAFN